MEGFLDDGLAAGEHDGRRVLGPVAVWAEEMEELLGERRYITAIGDNLARRAVVEVVERIYGGKLRPWTLVHPAARVGLKVEIGEGTCLAPSAIVTTRARIGRHSILNIKASVSHDCEIGDFVNINPGATLCGNVKVGHGAYIGAGATVIQKVKIGAGTVVGAGAVVLEDLPAGVTAVGVPARVIKRNGSVFAK